MKKESREDERSGQDFQYGVQTSHSPALSTVGGMPQSSPHTIVETEPVPELTLWPGVYYSGEQPCLSWAAGQMQAGPSQSFPDLTSQPSQQRTDASAHLPGGGAYVRGR